MLTEPEPEPEPAPKPSVEHFPLSPPPTDPRERKKLRESTEWEPRPFRRAPDSMARRSPNVPLYDPFTKSITTWGEVRDEEVVREYMRYRRRMDKLKKERQTTAVRQEIDDLSSKMRALAPSLYPADRLRRPDDEAPGEDVDNQYVEAMESYLDEEQPREFVRDPDELATERIENVRDYVAEGKGSQGLQNILKVIAQATPEELDYWQHWYGYAHVDAARLALKHGRPLDLVAGVIAVLSPKEYWPENLYLADRALSQDWDEVQTLLPNKEKAYSLVVDNDFSVIGGGKVFDFFLSIADPPAFEQAVVVDTHAINIWRGVRAGDAPQIGDYGPQRRRIQEDYRKAAQIAGLNPQAMQAITWVLWRQYPMEGELGSAPIESESRGPHTWGKGREPQTGLPADVTEEMMEFDLPEEEFRPPIEPSRMLYQSDLTPADVLLEERTAAADPKKKQLAIEEQRRLGEEWAAERGVPVFEGLPPTEVVGEGQIGFPVYTTNDCIEQSVRPAVAYYGPDGETPIAVAIPKTAAGDRTATKRSPIKERELKRWLDDPRNTVAILSAARSGSVTDSKRRHQKLMQDLQELGVPDSAIRTMRGQWEDPATERMRPEPSILVPNLPFEDALALARGNDQDAFIYKDSSGVVGMYSGYREGETPSVLVPSRDGVPLYGSDALKVQPRLPKEERRGPPRPLGEELYTGTRGLTFEFEYDWDQPVNVAWNGLEEVGRDVLESAYEPPAQPTPTPEAPAELPGAGEEIPAVESEEAPGASEEEHGERESHAASSRALRAAGLRYHRRVAANDAPPAAPVTGVTGYRCPHCKEKLHEKFGSYWDADSDAHVCAKCGGRFYYKTEEERARDLEALYEAFPSMRTAADIPDGFIDAEELADDIIEAVVEELDTRKADLAPELAEQYDREWRQGRPISDIIAEVEFLMKSRGYNPHLARILERLKDMDESGIAARCAAWHKRCAADQEEHVRKMLHGLGGAYAGRPYGRRGTESQFLKSVQFTPEQLEQLGVYFDYFQEEGFDPDAEGEVYSEFIQQPKGPVAPDFRGDVYTDEEGNKFLFPPFDKLVPKLDAYGQYEQHYDPEGGGYVELLGVTLDKTPLAGAGAAPADLIIELKSVPYNVLEELQHLAETGDGYEAAQDSLPYQGEVVWEWGDDVELPVGELFLNGTTDDPRGRTGILRATGYDQKQREIERELVEETDTLAEALDRVRELGHEDFRIWYLDAHGWQELVVPGYVEPEEVTAGKDGERAADLLPGGVGDDVEWWDIEPEPLAEGIKVELEHVDDPMLAAEIATDHAVEFAPGTSIDDVSEGMHDYYEDLDAMESAHEKKAADVGYAVQVVRREGDQLEPLVTMTDATLSDVADIAAAYQIGTPDFDPGGGVTARGPHNIEMRVSDPMGGEIAGVDRQEVLQAMARVALLVRADMKRMGSLFGKVAVRWYDTEIGETVFSPARFTSAYGTTYPQGPYQIIKTTFPEVDVSAFGQELPQPFPQGTRFDNARVWLVPVGGQEMPGRGPHVVAPSDLSQYFTEYEEPTPADVSVDEQELQQHRESPAPFMSLEEMGEFSSEQFQKLQEDARQDQMQRRWLQEIRQQRQPGVGPHPDVSGEERTVMAPHETPQLVSPTLDVDPNQTPSIRPPRRGARRFTAHVEFVVGNDASYLWGETVTMEEILRQAVHYDIRRAAVRDMGAGWLEFHGKPVMGPHGTGRYVLRVDAGRDTVRVAARIAAGPLQRQLAPATSFTTEQVGF